MSDDLVKRLRHLISNAYDDEVIEKAKDAMDEAADRIEQLEAALRQIASCKSYHSGDIVDIARAALEGKKDAQP